MWLIKVWDGNSNCEYHRKGSYDEVTAQLRHLPPATSGLLNQSENISDG